MTEINGESKKVWPESERANRKATGHYDKNGRMIFAGDDLAVDIHPTSFSKVVVYTKVGRVFWSEAEKCWCICSGDTAHRLNEHPSCDLQVVK